MFQNLSRRKVAVWWCATVIVIGAGAVVAGASITASNIELLLMACLVPPSVMLLVWRGAPPDTVAELLHSVNRPSKGARP